MTATTLSAYNIDTSRSEIRGTQIRTWAGLDLGQKQDFTTLAVIARPFGSVSLARTPGAATVKTAFSLTEATSATTVGGETLSVTVVATARVRVTGP